MLYTNVSIKSLDTQGVEICLINVWWLWYNKGCLAYFLGRKMRYQQSYLLIFIEYTSPPKWARHSNVKQTSIQCDSVNLENYIYSQICNIYV